VKLADFGIARLFGTTQLTTAGGVLGTADYMSPEQAEGRPVTDRCDQYSLGGVMYALLAGRPPFVAQNLPQMLQLQRFAEPDPVRRYAPDVPEQLERLIGQLLAKDPADRFPNTQILARHLQAMVRALSRPAADDFALAPDEPPATRDVPGAGRAPSAAIEATLPATNVASSAAAAPSSSNPRRQSAIASDHAATVAADEVLPIRRPTAGAAHDATMPPSGDLATIPVERQARFTTLEEEEARRRAEHRRPWLAIAAQLAALVAVLGTFVAAALYLSRPPSADALYDAIRERVDSEDAASLSDVAGEIDEFLKRYPADTRTRELKQYKERIEIDRLERRLYWQARLSGASDSSLLPVEQMYLRAMNIAEHSPDEAMTRLRSLVDLYGPASAGENSERIAAVVQLADRQLAALDEQIAERRERQMASLKERLDAAARLSETDPQRAAAMYRAMIDLHAAEAWAEGAVEEARRRLLEIEGSNP
jgi:serine/threonine-protein kinase